MPTTDLSTDPPEPAVPKRYTSYQPGITFSLLETVLAGTPNQPGLYFEYAGMLYAVFFNPASHRGHLSRLYPPSQYVSEECNRLTYANEDGSIRYDRIPPPTRLAEFTDPAFLDQYEIEGKSVAWILAHQHVWKRKLEPHVFDRVWENIIKEGTWTGLLPGTRLEFVYKKIRYRIRFVLTSDAIPWQKGWYIISTPQVTVDVLKYGPHRACTGNTWWTEGVPFAEAGPDTRVLSIGPFENTDEILDMVRLDNTTLRVLFDTEYDDGPTLCATFC